MCYCMRNRPPLGTILQEKATEVVEVVGDFASYLVSNIPCVKENDRERYRKHHEDAWSTQNLDEADDRWYEDSGGESSRNSLSYDNEVLPLQMGENPHEEDEKPPSYHQNGYDLGEDAEPPVEVDPS